MDIINNNPYRFLGVYSNSPTKERVANKGKMNAFLKVGKQVSFPLDLPHLLPPITRNVSSVADAESGLALPADQLRHAQFWWMNAGPLDAIAFNHLFEGHTEVAESIWSKKDNVSSLQNRVVLALAMGKTSLAIQCAESLYTRYSDAFVHEIVGAGFASDIPLWQSFLDTMLDAGTDALSIAGNMQASEWKEYIGQKTVDPLIESITKAVTAAKATKGNGAAARLKAGQKLMTDTKDALSQLKKMLPSTDIRYQTVADKLANEILQCGIDYYNHSDDDDSATKAMKLQKYAYAVAVGSMAKQRCKENVDILKKIISELPPQEIIKEYRIINTEIRNFIEEAWHLKGCKDFLRKIEEPLVEIKDKVGVDNSDYIDLSTHIANILLNFIIEQYNNEVNEGLQTRLKTNEDGTLFSLMWCLRFCWNIILNIQKLNTSSDFKNSRLSKNVQVIKSFIEQIDNEFDVCFWIGGLNKFSSLTTNFLRQYWGTWYVDVPSPYWLPGEYDRGNCYSAKCSGFMIRCDDEPTIDLRIETDYFQECQTLFAKRQSSCHEYETYLKKFPNGKYVSEVKTYIEKTKQEYNLYRTYRVDISGCETYMKNYPNGWYINVIREEHDDMTFEKHKKAGSLKKYLKTYPNGRHSSEVQELIDSANKFKLFTFLAIIAFGSILYLFVALDMNIVFGIIVAFITGFIILGIGVPDDNKSS